MKYCTVCGNSLKDNAKFCPVCGSKVKIKEQAAAEKDEENTEIPIKEEQASVHEEIIETVNEDNKKTAIPEPTEVKEIQEPKTELKKEKPKVDLLKKSSILQKKIFWIMTAAVLTVAIVIGFLFGKGRDIPSVKYSYLSEEKTPTITYEIIDKIWPSLYKQYDSIVNFTANCSGGDMKVLVSVEVPGYSQVYEQQYTLTDQITEAYIKPPMLTGELDLNSEKDSQIVFSVTDQETGNVLVKETKPIKIESEYDFLQVSGDIYGDYAYTDKTDTLAWVTPEDESILQVKRAAIDWLSLQTDGQLQSFVGYQDTGFFEDVQMNTYVQALAIQGAMSDLGVRYNATSFSLTETTGAIQRMQKPAMTLEQKSGLCIETSFVMASALESAGMHCFLIMPPGHCQVAVESWSYSGEYFLIETTILPLTDENAGNIVTYMTHEQWASYIQDPWGNGSGQCTVVDCETGKEMGIVPISN